MKSIRWIFNQQQSQYDFKADLLWEIIIDYASPQPKL